jgi:putative transcriptional regulator
MDNKVRELREAKGLSQEQFGQALLHRVTRQTINALERGRYNPSGVLVLDIANFFQIPAQEIFDAESV